MAEEYVAENDETANGGMENWNDDMMEDMVQAGANPDFNSLRVYSRDWTVETIYSQIQQGNIELNPKFQRRNAWNDNKRTRLIESLIAGIPVPEVVFAEHPKKKKSFIVIDGKQRLLTIAGFMNPEKVESWRKPALREEELTVIDGLKNGLTFDQMQNDPAYVNERRAFLNADVRCTVVSNYESPDILYNIFYRLNSGGVPLSSQELRQALNAGPFADYLMEITNSLQPIHSVLKRSDPDPRLRDAELILRFMVFEMFSGEYRGNLRRFLDDKMKYITENWKEYSEQVEQVYSNFNRSIGRMQEMLGNENIGRIYPPEKWGRTLNKTLFEVEAYYFMHLDDKVINGKEKHFKTEFKNFCRENTLFRESIQIATTNPERYATRYKLFCEFINETFETDISVLPLPKK